MKHCSCGIKKAPSTSVGPGILTSYQRRILIDLVEEGIIQKTWKPEELHDRKQPVEPVSAVQRGVGVTGTRWAIQAKPRNDIKEIIQLLLPTVDSLFVAVGRQIWGEFAPDTMV